MGTSFIIKDVDSWSSMMMGNCGVEDGGPESEEIVNFRKEEAMSEFFSCKDSLNAIMDN